MQILVAKRISGEKVKCNRVIYPITLFVYKYCGFIYLVVKTKYFINSYSYVDIMRIKQLSEKEYTVLGKKEFAHRESDRLISKKTYAIKCPTAKQKPYIAWKIPDTVGLIALGKYRQKRIMKDRMYYKKKSALRNAFREHDKKNLL